MIRNSMGFLLLPTRVNPIIFALSTVIELELRFDRPFPPFSLPFIRQ